MRAFVLSGAGARGPLEIGALAALLEAGVQPDFLVGTSAGAVNGCFVAGHGYTFATLNRLVKVWGSIDGQDVYPGNLISAGWRVTRGRDSLYHSDGLRKLITENLPPGVTTFGELKMPLYTTSVDLRSGRLFVFGEDGSAPIVDAVLASASIPIVHPPVEFHGLQLVDGGVVANVAASFAMDKGATEIYAINAGYGGAPLDAVHGVVDIAQRTLQTMLNQSLLRDLDRAARDPAVTLHHIHLTAFGDVGFTDFGRAAEMARAGHQAAKAYLDAPQPLKAPSGAQRPIFTLGETFHGARELIPTNW